MPKYIEEKHKSLNDTASKIRHDIHGFLVEEYHILSKEIDKHETYLKKARLIFVIVFALGMIAGITVSTIMTVQEAFTGTEIAVPATAGTLALGPELALYQAITNPMQKKIDDLDHRRRDISNSLVKDKENIAKMFSNENRIITEELFGITGKINNNK